MCGHQTLVVYLCVSECICVSAYMLSTGWQLVLSQSAGRWQHYLPKTICAYSLQCYTTSNGHTSLNTALVMLSE